MNPFTRQLRKLTIASHFLLIIFLGIFLIYTENFTYIYEVGRLKNTATIVLNFIFATLLSIHYILILINLVDSVRILHIGTDKPLRTILWGSYPLILVLWLSGFNLDLFIKGCMAPIQMFIHLL